MTTNRRENYKYFCHKECEFYPCHRGIPDEDFNCIFCYCPLYFLEDCGGIYSCTKSGVKSCKDCAFPHDKHNFDVIVDKLTKALSEEGGD